MTAVKWLENKLKTYLSWSSFLEEDFEQANKMFEQQIYEAFYDGEENAHKYKSSPTLYYNETYGSKGSETKTDKI